ncbi:MAG: hypothetical protein RTU09_06245 [Candidatus Thorarchaeota archaeon]
MTEETADTTEMQLPFPHGIEVELQVIMRDGNWFRGEEILNVFDKLVSSAKNLLDKRIRSASVPSVKSKYRHSSQTEEGERGSRIVVNYEDPAGEAREYTVIGHDPNVTSLTWILEVATPPCTTLEELAWWVQTLIAISYDALPKDMRVLLISTGLNPTQEYMRNLSFGEHHHILSPEVEESSRLAVYNMIRNFTPHLIALSVNSPFENKKATDEVYIDSEGRTRAPRCKRSIRLIKNTTQMGPTNEFELIPYMKEPDKEFFAKHVNRSFARMVDMYPFTDYGTIEVRVFDTQLSVPRRVGIALILQALALKAIRMSAKGMPIPDMGVKSIAANRASAIAAGLWGSFHPGEDGTNPEFMEIYNHPVNDDGTLDNTQRNRFMGDAVASMLYLIRDELEDMRAIDNPFMQPLMVSVFGSEFVEPRTTCADYQLDVYAKSEQNMITLLGQLGSITRECCTNWLYDPLEGVPRLPTWLCWWKGLEPEIIIDKDRIFAGQEAGFDVSIRNRTDRDLDNLTLSYRIEDSERNVTEQNILPILRIESGEIHVARITFPTKRQVHAYNIIASIGVAGKEISLSSTINTYWMKTSVKPATTTQFADGRTPILFSGEIDTNYPMRTTVTCEIAVINPKKETVIVNVHYPVVVEGGDLLFFESSDLPPLAVPAEASKGVERCVLRIRLIDHAKNIIALSTSKPFYVGFVKRGPEIIIQANLKGIHSPGGMLRGDVVLKAGRHEVPKGSRLIVHYRTDTGETHLMAEGDALEAMSSTLPFDWQIPSADGGMLARRTASIRASLVSNGMEIASNESDGFVVAHVEVRANIDSLKAPDRSHIGGKVAGWLRIRRNTEQGEPAALTMSLRFADDDEHIVLKQTVKQSRNLSLAYGPFTIPEPTMKIVPSSITLVAKLDYANAQMDCKTAEISLVAIDETRPASLNFSGVPTYVSPDDQIHAAIHVINSSAESLNGMLLVGLESVVGTEEVFNREIDLDAEETRVFAIPVRIPLSAEMSTAHLKATLRLKTMLLEKRHRFKVKAIEEPLFHVRFSIKDDGGEEIPGLVPRETDIMIGVRIQAVKRSWENLAVSLRVMSKREIVKEFRLPIPEPETEFKSEVRWTTPQLEAITGYYLDATIIQGEISLPARAVKCEEKTFAVY